MFSWPGRIFPALHEDIGVCLCGVDVLDVVSYAGGVPADDEWPELVSRLQQRLLIASSRTVAIMIVSGQERGLAKGESALRVLQAHGMARANV